MTAPSAPDWVLVLDLVTSLRRTSSPQESTKRWLSQTHEEPVEDVLHLAQQEVELLDGQLDLEEAVDEVELLDIEEAVQEVELLDLQVEVGGLPQ